MSKLTIAIVALAVAILVGSISGTIYYYNGVLERKNSQISALSNQILNQENEIANLTNQVASLNSLWISERSNLTTALGIAEVSRDIFSEPYNHLFIEGTVTNVGKTLLIIQGCLWLHLFPMAL